MCSSDLIAAIGPIRHGQVTLTVSDRANGRNPRDIVVEPTDRKSVVSGKSVDLGGRRIIKKKTTDLYHRWRQTHAQYHSHYSSSESLIIVSS